MVKIRFFLIVMQLSRYLLKLIYEPSDTLWEIGMIAFALKFVSFRGEFSEVEERFTIVYTTNRKTKCQMNPF